LDWDGGLARPLGRGCEEDMFGKFRRVGSMDRWKMEDGRWKIPFTCMEFWAYINIWVLGYRYRYSFRSGAKEGGRLR